jgi:hypothetical protein
MPKTEMSKFTPIIRSYGLNSKPFGRSFSIRRGPFIEVEEEEIEQSIPERFETVLRQYPDRIPVKTTN